MTTIVPEATAKGWFPKVADPTTEWRAAERYVAERCSWDATDETGAPLEPPGDLVEAVRLATGRFLARRESPDGLVGMTEFGPARVAAIDRDLDRLMAPWRKAVLA